MIDISNLFEYFNRLNVLILGDIMIDRYLTGDVSRISPEAPVPVVHFRKEENRLGGAANVALNIKAMGATPFLVSVTGDDENARTIARLLPENQLIATGILNSSERMTTVKTRIMAQNQQLLRVDREDTHDLSEPEAQSLLNRIISLLDQQRIDVILFQDYNKGVLTPPVIQTVIREAIRRGIPTAVDPTFNNFWAYQQVTRFKPNLKEARAQLPGGIQVTPEALRKASAEIRARLGNDFTLITLSEMGIYYEGRGAGMIIPTQPRSIVDVCGAGDTVISIVALGLGLGLDMHETAMLANLAGGQVCERVGVVPVDKKQLEREFEILKKGKVVS